MTNSTNLWLVTIYNEKSENINTLLQSKDSIRKSIATTYSRVPASEFTIYEDNLIITVTRNHNIELLAKPYTCPIVSGPTHY